MELALHNRSSDIPLVHQALDRFAAQHKLVATTSLARLQVAIEEHLTNIVSYGYDPGQPGTIRVRFSLLPSALRVEIEDDARPFNPLERPEVDTSLVLDEKPLGGLGVHLIRRSVDEVSYARADNRNVLVMVTRLAV